MANCVFNGCHTNRNNKKYDDIGLFKLPGRKTEFYTSWKEKIVQVIKRYRVVDTSLGERIKKGKVWVCERHFKPEEIERTGTGIKTQALQAIPSLNLPQKSHEEAPKAERRHINIVKEIPQPQAKPTYKSFQDLKQKVGKLKLNGWSIEESDDKLTISKFLSEYTIPYIKIVIDDCLEIVASSVLGWLLDLTHSLFKFTRRTVRTISVSKITDFLSSLKLCPGLNWSHNHGLTPHIVPQDNIDIEVHIQNKQFLRHSNCQVLFNGDNENCTGCLAKVKALEYEQTKRVKASNLPAKVNAPLKNTNPSKVISAIKEDRKTIKLMGKKIDELEATINRMKKEIEDLSVDLDDTLIKGIDTIMEANKQTMSPFMKLFWEQQRLYATNNGHINKYHPMIIRFALSLASKSPSAYKELRDSKILILPCLRTLRDYRNAITPMVGFNPEVIKELHDMASGLEPHQRYISIVFDEMKIKEGLVFEKNTNQIVGFVDLGDPELNFSTFENPQELASHIFMYYVRGITSDIKFPLAYYATRTMDCCQIFTTFWDAVGALELSCNLRVIAAVSDGASSNRKFYAIHNQMCGNNGSDIVYRTVNLYAPERYICFFPDAPHLLKTTRNCLFNSGNGSHARNMWNNGDEIVWRHIWQLANDEMASGGKLNPAISFDHVNLDSRSKMNVKLAAQVLSNRVATILKNYYPKESHGTAGLCEMMNKFFDILNIRCEKEGIHKRNDTLLPIRDINDTRLNWLKHDFLHYLNEWKTSVDSRKGFTQKEKNRMFLSFQTYEGLQMSVHSTIEATRFLLSVDKVHMVLTYKFNQDCLEENFGRHRSLGRDSTNPTLYQFGYQVNTLRTQRSVVPATGNTRGAYSGKRKFSWYQVDETALKKRSKEDKGLGL